VKNEIGFDEARRMAEERLEMYEREAEAQPLSSRYSELREYVLEALTAQVHRDEFNGWERGGFEPRHRVERCSAGETAGAVA
jgi:hypothetical protein